MVQERYGEDEILVADILRNLGGAHQRVRLIGHPEDGVPTLPPELVVPPHQGQAVEHVPDVDHDRQDHGLDQGESGNEEIDGEVLSGAGIDHRAHEDGP